jgi:glycosyltransferase involved in cell wall biosynthesis
MLPSAFLRDSRGMQVLVLDLSRNPRPYDHRLNGIFRDATVTQVDKTAWKKYGAPQLWRATRGIEADTFLIAVDDVSSVQDGFLLRLLAAASAARRSGLLEMSTGTIHWVRTSKLLLVDVPVTLLRGVVTAVFTAAFVLLVFALAAIARLRSVTIRGNYGHVGAITKVIYLKSDLALNITAGGSIAHTRGVINGFISNQVQVSIISNEDVDWLRVERATLDVVGRTKLLNVIRETERMANGLYLALRAASIVRRRRPDVIYQRKCHFDLSGVLLSLWFRVPLVIEGNDSVVEGVYWERTRLRWIAARVERLQFAACSRAVSISQPLLETYARLGYDTNKIRVIFNGVDVDRFDTDSSRKEVPSTRKNYGASAGTIVIGFVGTFGQWHGIQLLSKAIVELLQERQDVLFVLIGDGELRSTCEREVREAGVIDRVRFLGLVPAVNVPRLLAACDVLVSPHSRSPDGRKFFGSPTKLFEYMAAARAIVASDLDQIGEVLEHEESALLFEPDSLPGFLAALRRVCDDQVLRQRLAAESRRVVSERYTWHANVSQVIEALTVQR